RMKEVYQVVRDACDACIAMMRPGTPAVKAHLAAKSVLEKAGLDQYRLHTSGYGVAPAFPPAWTENMHLFGDSKYVLQPGMVVSVEPPVFIHKERLGVRIIDNILITENEPEILSTMTRDLIEV